LWHILYKAGAGATRKQLLIDSYIVMWIVTALKVCHFGLPDVTNCNKAVSLPPLWSCCLIIKAQISKNILKFVLRNCLPKNMLPI